MRCKSDSFKTTGDTAEVEIPGRTGQTYQIPTTQPNPSRIYEIMRTIRVVGLSSFIHSGH